MSENSFETEKINGQPEEPEAGKINSGSTEPETETDDSVIIDNTDESEKSNGPDEFTEANTGRDIPDGKIIYRWDYRSQAEHDSQQKTDNGRRGIKAYALIVTVAFVISFAILAFVLIMNSRGGAAVNYGSSQIVQTIQDSYNSTVAVSITTLGGTGTGSGVILTSDGYIVTNAHVVDNATSVTVIFYNGMQKEAEVIGLSVDDDVALIKVNATGLRPAPIGDSSACLAGEEVFAIGSPAGLDYAWTVTRGSVSYPDRLLKEYDSTNTVTRRIKVIQTDTVVNKGNSGGPLFNARGEVIGIVTLKLTNKNGNDYDGLGFALPINGVITIVNELKKYGNADGIESPLVSKRPLIGIVGVAVTEDVYYFFNDTGVQIVTEEEYLANPEKGFRAEVSGVYVESVTEGFNAGQYLKPGDYIVEVNGAKVYTVQGVSGIINNLEIGDSVKIKYYRNGSYTTADIVLKEEQ